LGLARAIELDKLVAARREKQEKQAAMAALDGHSNSRPVTPAPNVYLYFF
jgi:hypothetical protein